MKMAGWFWYTPHVERVSVGGDGEGNGLFLCERLGS